MEYSGSTTVRTSYSLSTLPITGDVHVARLLTQRETVDSDGFRVALETPPSADESQGFATREAIDAYVSGAAETLRFTHHGLVTAEWKERLRTEGYGGRNDRSKKNWFHDLQSAHPFNEIHAAQTEGTFDPSLIVLFDTGSNTVLGPDGNALPMALRFSYIEGRIDNSAYDLHGALPLLKTRSDVVFSADGGSLRLHPIPHYNADPGRSYHIPFLWQPDPADWARLWEHCVARAPAHPCGHLHQGAFEIDLFGLRAAGLAAGDSYYDTFPPPSEEDEDAY